MSASIWEKECCWGANMLVGGPMAMCRNKAVQIQPRANKKLNQLWEKCSSVFYNYWLGCPLIEHMRDILLLCWHRWRIWIGVLFYSCLSIFPNHVKFIRTYRMHCVLCQDTPVQDTQTYVLFLVDEYSIVCANTHTHTRSLFLLLETGLIHLPEHSTQFKCVTFSTLDSSHFEGAIWSPFIFNFNFIFFLGCKTYTYTYT